MSVSHLLLENAADDINDADTVKRLLRDVREARAAKLRKRVSELQAGKQVAVRGVGALEVGEMGGFIRGVVDGLRGVGASKEAARREREAEERETREEDSDEDML